MRFWLMYSLLFCAMMVSPISLHAEARKIQNWLICGPFADADLETECFSNESAVIPKEGEYSGGKLWRRYNFVKEVYDLEEGPAFGYQDYAVGYAYVEIMSDTEGWIQLQVGSDDGNKIWWNGKLILVNPAARALNVASDKANVKLQKGINRLLMKINDLSGGWQFSVQMQGLLDTALDPLKFNPEGIILERLPMKKVRGSTVQAGDEVLFSPKFSVDENMTTRWSSEHYEPQWYEIYFDGPVDLSRVDLYWENAFASEYKLSTTLDGENWEDVYIQLQGDGGHEIAMLNNPKKAIAMRFYGMKKGSDWGMSLWELEAYGWSREGSKEFQDSISTLEAEVAKPYPVSSVVATTEQAPNPGKGEDFVAANAVDNNLKTRWSSAFSDPQSIELDLGEVKKVHQIVLFWETACAKAYSVEISSDHTTWETVFSTSDNKGGRQVLYYETPKEARYVRMSGTIRTTTWGYSLWEFQVF